MNIVKIISKTAAAMLLMSFMSVANAGLIFASADLDFSQEVDPSNPGPSAATGTAQVVFNTMTNTLDVMASVTGISFADITFPAGPLAFGAAGPFHIHEAPAGVNGAIVVPFSEAGFFTATADGLSIVANDIPFDSAILPSLSQDGLYFNLHTLDFGSGEIRGQITVPGPATLGLLVAGLLGLRFVRRRRGFVA